MNPTETSRRAVLRKCLLMAGATAVALPDTWRKPLIDSVMLPAHAQASVFDPIFSANRVTNLTSATRTPSGGTPVTALASMELSGCIGVAGVSVSCTLEADVSGTTIPLGTTAATSDASGSYTLNVTAPSTSVADLLSISFITAVCTAGSTSETLVLFPSDWAAASAGTPPAPAGCSLL